MKARTESFILLIITSLVVTAKISILIVCFAVSLRADPPAGYYQTATNKTGFALRAALHEIINDHKVIPYFHGFFLDTSDALRVLDQDSQNPANVFLTYAQRPEPTNTFGLAAGWNREHLWPNSYGLDDVEPAHSDLFNLRAEDATVNSDRSNLYFDTSDTSSASYQLPAHPEALQCSQDADSWEPPAPTRGDIARALFYMDVRYEGDRTNELQLRLTDATSKINNTNAIMGKLSTLLRWHEADPVDAGERRRNDLIYQLYQQNRNPFVDHPEWVNAVFRPRLLVVRTGNNVELAWDAGWTNAAIQGSLNLRTWSQVSTNRLPATNAFRFFRLTVPVD